MGGMQETIRGGKGSHGNEGFGVEEMQEQADRQCELRHGAERVVRDDRPREGERVTSRSRREAPALSGIATHRAAQARTPGDNRTAMPRLHFFFFKQKTAYEMIW